jgi:hypothetical protein
MSCTIPLAAFQYGRKEPCNLRKKHLQPAAHFDTTLLALFLSVGRLAVEQKSMATAGRVNIRRLTQASFS